MVGDHSGSSYSESCCCKREGEAGSGKEGTVSSRWNLLYLPELSPQESSQSLFFHRYHSTTLHCISGWFVKKPDFAMERGAVFSPLEANTRFYLFIFHLAWLCSQTSSCWSWQCSVVMNNWTKPCSWFQHWFVVPSGSTGHTEWTKKELAEEGRGTGRAYRFLLLLI